MMGWRGWRAFRRVAPCVRLALLMAVVAGCATPSLMGPQIPGRRGLRLALRDFETAARWRNWPLLMEGFYLPEHRQEVRAKYEGDAARWFRATPVGAALAGGELGGDRRLCVLALREKHVSPRFEPHLVVYYRVQAAPCRPENGALPKAFASGQMEWGYEVAGRRWVHLRSLK